jgi:hypothetical protein
VRFFTEFTLRFFAPLRMTDEGFRMTDEGFRMINEGFRMTGCEGFRMTNSPISKTSAKFSQ